MKYLTMRIGALVLALAAHTAAAADSDVPPAIQAAVASPDRLAEDRARDADRKPGAVLAFLGIKPGMHVFDLLGGGGYYAEILSRAVGPEGSVTMHNNKAYLPFVKDALEAHFGNGRLSAVERPVVEIQDLDLESNHYDAITFVLGFHDTYFVGEGWLAIDRPKLFAELYDGLKPGGVLGIVDHDATAGSDPHESGNKQHRIDQAIVRRDLEAAGFVFDGAADMLKNPGDDLSVSVFADGIRGKTSRFVHRYRKPG